MPSAKTLWSYNLGDLRMKEMIKKLASLKKRKEVAEKKASDLKSEYEELKKDILGAMNKEGLDSVKSSGLSLSSSPQEVVKVEDWEKFYSYIHKYKAYDLLQKRVGKTAALDRIADGKKVPVTVEKIRVLNVRSAK
jgi:hypothetical protein